jgi:hypothetical protein
MADFSVKMTVGSLTIEATANHPDTAKDLFDYALDKSGLVPKS